MKLSKIESNEGKMKMKTFKVRNFVVVDCEIVANSKSGAYSIAKEVMKYQGTEINHEFIAFDSDTPYFKDMYLLKGGYVILDTFVNCDENDIVEIEDEDDVKDIA